MSDRVLKYSAEEFERGVVRLVAKLFEDNRISPDPSREIPVIGTWTEYDPHGSREEHAELEQIATAALLARHWFEGEAPRWALPLPLTEEECLDWINRDPWNRRNPIVAEYGRLLRGRWWQQIERAPTFCDFYASKRG